MTQRRVARPRVIAVSGVHHSGKTTVAELIVAELVRRNYTVGTVKSIHRDGFSIDTPGSNTHRHRMAGASMVTAVSDGETAIMFARRAGYDEIISWYDTDWVIIEGARSAPYPRIVCARTESDIEERFDEHTFAICGPYANEDGDRVETWRGVPVIDARLHFREVVDLAEKHVPGPTPMPAPGNFETAITVDGERVAMNPFTQEFVARTIVGMLSALKDCPADGHEVRIEIRRF
jgi:molybdopterin-guanine dinucleotide biosynthesis protein B